MWNNKVFLGGARLTADPEIKVIGENGNKVANFRVAVNRRLVKGQEHPEADFFRVSAFGTSAEFIEKYFKKGNAINIWGRLQNNTYEKDGEKRTVTDIVAEEVGFAEAKAKSESTSDNTAPAKAAKPAPAVQEDDDDNELPF